MVLGFAANVLCVSDGAEKPKGKREVPKVKGVYERKSGSGIWYIRYTDEHGELQRESIGPRSLAIQILKERTGEVARRKRVGPDEAQLPPATIPTVAEAIDDFCRKQGAEKSSWRSDATFARLWKERLGEKRLNEVTRKEVELTRDFWLTERAPQTVRNRLSFLSHIYNLAIEDGLHVGNPVAAAGLPPTSEPRIRWLKDTEEPRLRRHMPGEDFEIVELAYHTGLRRGELFGLQRENIDLKRRILSLIVGRTHKRIHEVRLNQRAYEIIKRRLESHDSEWLLVGKHGDRLDAGHWYNRVFLPAVRAAGIRNFRFHDLRHTTATMLRRKGARLEDVADVLGHAGLEMTRRYAHILPDTKDSLMDTLLEDGPQPKGVTPQEGPAKG